MNEFSLLFNFSLRTNALVDDGLYKGMTANEARDEARRLGCVSDSSESEESD